MLITLILLTTMAISLALSLTLAKWLLAGILLVFGFRSEEGTFSDLE